MNKKKENFETTILNNSVKLAIVSDLHYGTNSSNPNCRGEIADILLQRIVFRLNRLVHPDITLVLGDVLDDVSSRDAEKKLLHIKSILDKLESPYIIIPGNHDCGAEIMEDICGIRFLSFIDNEEPGFNASRSPEDLARFRKARKNYSGPIISLQHACLLPPGRSEVPHNYTNANEIISVMKELGVFLSISGHYHKGSETVRDGNVTFINAPGLCEAPFPYTVININRGQIQRYRQELAMDANLQLCDNHIHTQLAYCNDNIIVDKAIALAGFFGLSGLSFTEHSGQLYFEKKQYWDKTCLKEGMSAARNKDNRMAEYLKLKHTYQQSTVRFGLEVDCDYKGNLLLKKSDLSDFNYIIGAMHGLPGLNKDIAPSKKDADDYLSILEKLLVKNIDVLAHPFRVFRRCGWIAPQELFLNVANLLRKYNTAAEINFHTNEPPVEFIRICLNQGVKFSLGSDAHQMAEIGDFAYHLSLLKEAGFDGDLTDILLPTE